MLNASLLQVLSEQSEDILILPLSPEPDSQSGQEVANSDVAGQKLETVIASSHLNIPDRRKRKNKRTNKTNKTSKNNNDSCTSDNNIDSSGSEITTTSKTVSSPVGLCSLNLKQLIYLLRETSRRPLAFILFTQGREYRCEVILI